MEFACFCACKERAREREGQNEREGGGALKKDTNIETNDISTLIHKQIQYKQYT